MTAVFRAPSADALIVAGLDSFTAVFHRASGITHLLTSPAPEILAMLGERALSIDSLLVAMAERYELADGDRAALAARVDELVVAGLVAPA